MTQTEKEYIQATSGDVVKLEAGQSISGVFVVIEPSKMYKDSFALKLRQGDRLKTIFVSSIVAELISGNSIMTGQDIKLTYKGKVKAQNGKFEYNDYELFYVK